MTGSRLLLRAVPAIALIALAIPASASAQATRTWVSGVGDDANPCSRTAPCKTFAGAISKTATRGEINCLDPGGFGGVTITKSLTIKCHYTEGGVLVSGTNAIVVNAPTDARVTLKGLDINGLGTGLNGIRILQASSVKIVDVEIFGFVRNGVDVSPATGTLAKVVVERSHIHDNTGNGVLGTPSGTGQARITVRNNSIDDNGCGVTAAQFGPDPAFNFASNCGTVGTPNGNTAATSINAFDNGISDSTRQAVFSNGGASTVRIGGNRITGSVSAPALQAINAGALTTFGNNMVVGNPGGNGNTTGSAGAFSKRRN
jgi:Right handed beta helix region